MKYLVTGGGGFLGAWIARRLAAEGHEARVFDRTEDRSLLAAITSPALAQDTGWVQGDVTQAADVLAAAEGCAGIIHLAALLTPACHADPVRGATVNLLGTLNVFEAARRLGHNQVCYASTAGVFGPDDGVQPYPTTHYGAFKLACEGSARAYWQDGIASVGFRPLVVYGPGRSVGSTAGVTLACRAAARSERYAIPFTGRTDLIYVEDVAAAFVAAATRRVMGAHVFTLTGEVADADDVVAQIQARIPGAALSTEGDALPITPDIVATPGITAVLGDLPRTSLADGLDRTLAFYRERR